MKHCKTLLVAILYCVGFCSCAAQKQAGKYTSSFFIKAVPYSWTLLDGTKPVEILDDSSFALTAAKGTDLHYPASGAFRHHNAPKVLFAPAASFEFSAKLEPRFADRYDGGALLLYSDTTQWAKILFQWTGEKTILGMSVVKEGLTDDSYFAASDSAAIYLKLKKTGAVCAFYTSADGIGWSLTRQFVYKSNERIRLGFYAQSPVGSECRVVFSSIRYTMLK